MLRKIWNSDFFWLDSLDLHVDAVWQVPSLGKSVSKVTLLYADAPDLNPQPIKLGGFQKRLDAERTAISNFIPLNQICQRWSFIQFDLLNAGSVMYSVIRRLLDTTAS